MYVCVYMTSVYWVNLGCHVSILDKPFSFCRMRSIAGKFSIYTLYASAVLSVCLSVCHSCDL